MKNLFTTLLLLALICGATHLTAQTYKQKVRSAELLNQILPPSLKITPEMISKTTQKELRADIQAAGYSKDFEAALLDQMMPVKAVDWRGIVVKLSQECNARFFVYGISIDGEVESFPGFHFSPDNKCGSLSLRLAALGLLDPFTPASPDDNYTVCPTTTCITNIADSSGSCCFNVIYKVPEGKECPPAECTAYSCDCGVDLSGEFWSELYMEK
jgi:hypothetical protein